MSRANIRKDAGAYGFYLTRALHGDRYVSRWGCRCQECGEETTWGWGINSSPELMLKSTLQAGWQQRHKGLVCFACVDKAKGEGDVAKKLEVAMNPKLQRKVFALLDDYFDEERRLYRNGWSDKKVAESAETSEQFVESVRRAAYGELAEDPAITAIRDEILSLSDEMKLLVDTTMEQMSKIETKITALHTRLDGYAMKKAS